MIRQGNSRRGSHLLRQVLLASVAAAATAGMSGAAFAQDEGVALEEVIVTAEKRAANVQNVPISMTVLTGDELQEFHDKNIHDLITRMPNVNLVTQGVNDVIYIRGFGSSPNNFAFDPTVSVYRDGIYAGKSGQFIEPLFDVERVEVLRGPQGALLGKNTAAGAISIVSAGPSREFGGEVAGAYKIDPQGWQATGFVTGALTETLSGRLAVKFLDQEGFLKNRATGQNDPRLNQQLARLSLLWAPTADLDVMFKLEKAASEMRGGINTAGPPNTAPPHVEERYTSDPYGPSGAPEINGVDSFNGSITANYQIGSHTLTSITGYSNFDRYPINGYDETNPSGGPTTPGINNLYQNGFPEDFEQVSQELRLLSPTGQKLEYVLGAYYDTSDWNLRQNIFYDLPSATGAQYTHFFQRSKTYSAFAIGTYHLSDVFRVKTSIRYTKNKKDGDFTSGTYYGDPLRVITAISGSRSEESVDPALTLQYDVAPRVMIYAAVANGSKSGGFVSNTFGVRPATYEFKPEKSTNFEVGMKSTLAGGRLQFNATAFQLEIKDLQVSSYVPVLSSFVTNNAGSATSKGAEFLVNWLPVDSLQLTLNLAYLDAKYDSYKGAACLAGAPISVCNPADPVSVAAHDLAGKELVYSSKWTGNLQARHTATLGAFELESTVIASYRSRYYKADNYSEVYGVQPGVTKIDARIALAPIDGRWTVALAGKNLTNEHTFSNSLLLGGGVTTQPRTINYKDELRSIWVEVSTRF